MSKFLCCVRCIIYSFDLGFDKFFVRIILKVDGNVCGVLVEVRYVCGDFEFNIDVGIVYWECI